jgi:hypothetical protein
MADKTVTLAGVAGVGDVVERLAAASTDELRAVLGRIQDAEKVTMALIRQRVVWERRKAVRDAAGVG